VSKCPDCGQSVSAFAAGCAVCGADLEAERARRAGKRSFELPTLPGIQGVAGIDWVHVVIAVLLAVAFSPLGLLLALYWALRANRYGETAMAVTMVVVAAVAIAAILDPFWFGSHLGI
jgi:hypothetical protein